MTTPAPALPDGAAVRRALAIAFPALRVERCALLGEGWDSQAWEVNGALVFRFPKRPIVADWLRREIALLPALAPALPAPIPGFTHVAARGSPFAPALPFVGYPMLRGVFLHEVPERLAPGAPLVGHLAAFLGALHAFPVARAVACGLPADSWASWVAEWRTFAAQVLDDGPGALDAASRAWAAATLRDFLAELTLAERPVAPIHRDLNLEHILIDPAGERITGVIDWGDVTLGDPALDFAGVAAACPPATLDALLAAYPRPVDGRFRERAVWYARLAPFHLYTFGRTIADPATIRAGLAAIRAVRRS